jgi:hypothetical protein
MTGERIVKAALHRRPPAGIPLAEVSLCHKAVKANTEADTLNHG